MKQLSANKMCRFFNRAQNAVARFRKNNAGFGAVEAALTLPIFIGITMAMIDYGLLFTKQMTATANANSIISTIQNNPTLTATELNDVITKASNSLVDFNSADACISTFITNDQAAAYAFVADKTTCDNTKRDVATAATPLPYFIATKGSITYKFLTPINAIFTSGKTEKKITFGQVARFGTKVPPVCTGPGEALQFDGTEYNCVVPEGTRMGSCVQGFGGWVAGDISWPMKRTYGTPSVDANGFNMSGNDCACEAGWRRILTGVCQTCWGGPSEVGTVNYRTRQPGFSEPGFDGSIPAGANLYNNDAVLFTCVKDKNNSFPSY